MSKELIGVGRRKRAVASVRLRRGKGVCKVNGKQLEDYFRGELEYKTVLSPIAKLELAGNYDIVIRTTGGGVEGQMIAARLGIARALVSEDETRRQVLKAAGFLTRDPRKRERKKYGLAGARKRFQFSKR